MIWIKVSDNPPPVNVPLLLFIKTKVEGEGFEMKMVTGGEYSSYSGLLKKRGWRIYTIKGKEPVKDADKINIIAWTLSVGRPMELIGMVDKYEHV